MTSSDNDSIVCFSFLRVHYRGTVGVYSTLVQSAGVYVSKMEKMSCILPPAQYLPTLRKKQACF